VTLNPPVIRERNTAVPISNPFTPAPSDAPTTLFVNVWGEPKKAGKTHFALTFPEPIRVLNFDFGSFELLPKFPGKDIQFKNLEMDEDLTPESANRLLQEFHGAWLWALKNSAGGHGCHRHRDPTLADRPDGQARGRAAQAHGDS
jgi:hypothetical protein